MKKINPFKITWCITLVLAILSLSLFTGFAITIDTDKISSTLLETICTMNNTDSVDVYIFLKRVDEAKIKATLLNDYGKEIDVYENKYRFYDEVVPDIVVNNRTIESLVGTDNVNAEYLDLSNVESKTDLQTRKNINREIANEMNDYIADKRKVYFETVDSYIDKFMEKHSITSDDIIFDTDYIEVIIAKVTKEQIAELSNDPLVESIDGYVNSIEVSQTCDAVPLIRGDSSSGLSSDDYLNYYGNINDGTGITIGIIEAKLGKYDPTDYNLSEAHNSGRLNL